jgi:hypothetical protein
MDSPIHELNIHGEFADNGKSFVVGGESSTGVKVDVAAKNIFLNFFGRLFGLQFRLRVFDEKGKQQDIFVIANSARQRLHEKGVDSSGGLGRSLATLLAGMSQPPASTVSLQKIVGDRYSRKEEKAPEHPMLFSAGQSIKVDEGIKKRLSSEFGIQWPADAESDNEAFWVQLLIANADNDIKTPRNATPEEATFVAEFLQKRTSPEYQYKCAVSLKENKPIEARKWFLKAADQGHSDAQTYLGYMFEEGIGGTKDLVKAREWYQKAAAQDDANAQNSLGCMYEQGEDPAQALAWYQKAAAQGHAAAQFNLGRMYEYGLGVDKDPAQALAWYQKAADQGHAGDQGHAEAKEKLAERQVT